MPRIRFPPNDHVDYPYHSRFVEERRIAGQKRPETSDMVGFCSSLRSRIYDNSCLKTVNRFGVADVAIVASDRLWTSVF